MGGGSWDANSWSNYAQSRVTGKASAQSIYTARSGKQDYSPNGVIRESRDSIEHPFSTPIVLGLDVTGSMSSILKVMAEKLGLLVTEILNRNPVSDPQILFAAIGDAMCDDYPLQVTQFESDIRIAEQLTDLYFEQGGGGNGFESYPLAWYFSANKTSTDNYEKRNKKGYLFTFGDDGYPDVLTKREIYSVFGDVVEKDIPIEDVLTQVNRKYEVYHFLMTQGGSHRDSDLKKWQKLLGERAIKVSDYSKIPELIVSILELSNGKDLNQVASTWDSSTAVVIRDSLNKLTNVDTQKELIKF